MILIVFLMHCFEKMISFEIFINSHWNFVNQSINEFFQKKQNFRKIAPVRKTPVSDRFSSEKSSDESVPLKSVENSQNYQIWSRINRVIKIFFIHFFFHTMRKENALKKNQQTSKLFSLITSNWKKIKKLVIQQTSIKTSPRCSLGNGPLGLANIWSRLLKHNWWDSLYGRVRIHADVFFGLTFNENLSLYGYIDRASPEFQLMHVYDQQLWLLFHRCGPPFFFLNSWR